MNRFLAALLLAPVLSGGALCQSAPARTTWTSFGAVDDFSITRDTTAAHSGRASIRFVADEPPTNFASIGSSTLATPYEGRRVHVTARLRGAQLEGGGGVVWARADGAGPAFSTTQGSPLRGSTPWTPVELTLDVPRGAKTLVVGVFSNGMGTLWVDDIDIIADSVAPLHFGFEDVTEFLATVPRVIARSPREAARPLDARGIENLAAFTRLLGYVRFFHPTPEAVTTNWDEFAVRGVRAVESAPTPDSLADVLRRLFGTIAPNVVVYRSGSTVPRAPVSPSPTASIVYWRHFGIGGPSGGAVAATQQNVYSSIRVRASSSAAGAAMPLAATTILAPGEKAPRIPDPSQPLQLTLGGGLSVSLPVAIYSTEAVIADTLRSFRPAKPSERFSADDRATRLASVALAWTVMQHFYPYHETVHVDWPAALPAALTRAATDQNALAFVETMDRLIAALRDGHGRIGSSLVQSIVPDLQLGWIEDKIVVVAVGDSSTAAGVRVGDVLLAVDGQPATGLLTAMSERVSGATPQWVRTVALSRILAGPPETALALRVSRAGVASTDLRVPRTTFQPAASRRPEKIAEIAPGTFYIDLERITDADFNAALPRLVAAKGIVFDMRGYPRQVNTPSILAHLTDSTIQSARFETPIVPLPDRAGMSFISGDWKLTPADPRITAKIAFLSGGGAISYAESTLGVVEAFAIGDIVGEPSAGTNGNVNPFTLPSQFTVSWTGMRVTKRDGTPHHGVGNVPTVLVSPTLAGVRAGRDEVLDRAVRLVSTPGLVP